MNGSSGYTHSAPAWKLIGRCVPKRSRTIAKSLNTSASQPIARRTSTLERRCARLSVALVTARTAWDSQSHRDRESLVWPALLCRWSQAGHWSRGVEGGESYRRARPDRSLSPKNRGPHDGQILPCARIFLDLLERPDRRGVPPPGGASTPPATGSDGMARRVLNHPTNGAPP